MRSSGKQSKNAGRGGYETYIRGVQAGKKLDSVTPTTGRLQNVEDTDREPEREEVRIMEPEKMFHNISKKFIVHSA